MGKIKDRFLDFYFNWPLLIDAILIFAIWFISKHFSFIEFNLEDKPQQLNLVCSLVGCSVSLAGFILAALTIIVTFKSNIKAKGLENASNAMEMILSSQHYNGIVKVFKSAILEFVICFLLLSCFWAVSDNISIWTLNRVNVSAILSIALTTFRSLLILFSVIEMEKS